MYVRDLDGNEYTLQATATNESELKGNQVLSSVIEYNKVNKLFIENLDRLWRVVDHDSVEHVIKYCKKLGKGNKMAAVIKAIPVFFDVLDNDRIYERYDRHMTAHEAFTLIFANTGFTFVLVDSFYAVQWEGFGDGVAKLETFKRAIERYKCEFEIIGTVVYLRTKIGRDTDIMYRHKLNASNIVQEIDANEMWTYARGYGDYEEESENGGWQNAKLVREYTSPLANILGERHAPPIKNGNITLRETMDEQLKILVDESLKISVSATIHDLRKQNYPIGQSKLGDRVFLIDERINLNEEVRIISQSITRDWKGNVIDINITFGSEGISKRHQSNLQTAIKNITDLLEGKQPLPYNVLPNVIRLASEALKSAMTELEFNNGIVARDPSDPNRLVLYNSAGLGISLDGGITFEEAITYLGINTKLLTAGEIQTNNIRIIGENNFFFWDGESLQAIDPDDVNRFVRLKSKGLVIGKGAITIYGKDNREFIIDGTPKFGMAVQARPFYNPSLVEFNGRFYTTNALEYVDMEVIYISHDARYLNITLGVRNAPDSTSDEVATHIAINEFSTNEEVGATVVSGNIRAKKDETVYVNLNVDLGVPTYQARQYYLRFRNSSGHSTNKTMVRPQRMWLNG